VLSDCLCLGVILVGGGGAIELVSEKLVVFGCWIIRAGEAIPFVFRNSGILVIVTVASKSTVEAMRCQCRGEVM